MSDSTYSCSKCNERWEHCKCKAMKKQQDVINQDIAKKICEILAPMIESVLKDNYIFEGNKIRGVWGPPSLSS